MGLTRLRLRFRAEEGRIECFSANHSIMPKVNTNNVPELAWSSPKGKSENYFEATG
jgi:hypothetical protein